MKTDLFNMIDTVNLGVIKLKELLKNYIKDENVPWQDRWEIFSKSPSYMLPYDSYYMDYNFDGKEIVWYDDFYKDRHSLVDNDDIIERLEENLGTEYRTFGIVTQEKIDQLKQDMLKSGVRTWTNDW